MDILLTLARWIDHLNDRFGIIAKYAVIASCLISAGNAVIRYSFNISSNAWLEIQWYLFAACVMLGASQVLRLNEHVRVDLFYGRLTGHGKVYVDLFGLIFFLVPVMSVMLWLSWPLFLQKLASGEMSSNAGGLVRWPAVLMLPLGFAMVLLQGLAEIVKRIAWLMHRYEMDIHYERPLQ
ncbi:TRAP transporter small permease subunit [Aquincola sp. S2]|uniref:TRAP transporter small permease protein n=1 Tax=Pseudaquabacterium terrae TaxID=2732868 RepID=A0ABX2ELG9_9BURK|nr:TRAP transporter small permease subunit [Aquabacterium terrae]NRF69497.1 TRAP transporter small permease subunit [Aquabacterium terrae]